MTKPPAAARKANPRLPMAVPDMRAELFLGPPVDWAEPGAPEERVITAPGRDCISARDYGARWIIPDTVGGGLVELSFVSM